MVVRNAHWHSVTLDELSEKAQFNVVEHDVGSPLILHEELGVGHVLVLETRAPCGPVDDGDIVLARASLAPMSL